MFRPERDMFRPIAVGTCTLVLLTASGAQTSVTKVASTTTESLELAMHPMLLLVVSNIYFIETVKHFCLFFIWLFVFLLVSPVLRTSIVLYNRACQIVSGTPITCTIDHRLCLAL